MDLGRVHKSTPRPAQKPRTRASDQSTDRAGAGADAGSPPPDEDSAADRVDASYQEWPLPDAVLQRIWVDGQAILQLQFTWATPCASHKAPAVMSTAHLLKMPNTHCTHFANTQASKGPTSNSGIERADSSETDGGNTIHTVARLLAY